MSRKKAYQSPKVRPEGRGGFAEGKIIDDVFPVEEHDQVYEEFGPEDTPLRNELIRLAHAKPELRPHLLPLLKQAAGKSAKNLPAPVERYVKEIKEKSPDYDDAKVWATAWSIYCKHKEPGSEHCKKDKSEYFKSRNAESKKAGNRLTVVPAHNRDYKGKKEVLEAWKAGKDFMVQDMMSPYDGSLINKQDARQQGVTHVNVRFNHLRKILPIKV